ncbi:hypothetical protein [Magnetococcus sp. PR-3]|uniref:hypothetical protein n=1 Tax=Magnetococcus sp. PR-3 TaxID=3120355 RepID=UPI002FCE2BB8
MSNKLILEVDGQRVMLAPKKAQDIADVNEVDGDRWLISDFNGSVPRLMMVDAQIKYAEIKLQRKLQEMGEGDENSRILTHWKKKRGESSTEILFSVVPGDIMAVHDDLAYESRDVHLNFSFNALLFAALNKYGSKQNVVVMFEHDRHVDYMVGKKDRILGAGRMSSFAATSEAKMALAETISEELKILEKQSHQKVERVVHFGFFRSEPGEEGAGQTTRQTSSTGFGQTAAAGDDKTSWVGDETELVDAGADTSWVIKLAEFMEASTDVLSPARFAMEDGSFLVTSIPKVTSLLASWDAANKELDIASYIGVRVSPWLTAAVWLLVVGGLFGQTWLERNVTFMKAETRKIESSLGQDEKVKEITEGQKDVVLFSEQLSKLSQIYDAKRIIADLSLARADRNIQILRLLISHENQTPSVVIEGRVNNSFSVASKDHEKFLNTLRSKGYKVEKSQLDTDILQLSFKVTLSRKAES